jgi:hypothetical protein
MALFATTVLYSLACQPVPFDPTTKEPAHTEYRPPVVTAVQKDVRAKGAAGAQAKSQAALPWLRNYLETMRPKLAGLPVANLTTDELIDVVTWEWAHIGLQHNGPATTPASIPDDDRLLTNLNNGYIQNVCQRYVMGVEVSSQFTYQDSVLVSYLGFPPFADQTRPTMREANNMPLYLASNVYKKDSGNFVYGKVTYVMSARQLADVLLVLPWDSGCAIPSARAHVHMCMRAPR